MHNGEQLGTDPPPSLAKKKEKKGEITKKITKSETVLSKKKTAEPKQGYAKHVTDTHTQKKSSHKVSKEKGVKRTVTAVR